jgi:hypothetical protein
VISPVIFVGCMVMNYGINTCFIWKSLCLSKYGNCMSGVICVPLNIRTLYFVLKDKNTSCWFNGCNLVVMGSNIQRE